MKHSLRLGVSTATLAALAALSACADGNSASSSPSNGDSGARATLDLAIPSAVIAPKEEVATYAVGDAEGYFSEVKFPRDLGHGSVTRRGRALVSFRGGAGGSRGA
ncbi:hypothetical protein [Streptomyces sp. HC307]|uniref:hypothetical protein n=1 Tax=Streptomyces flavusporus TaxID=3385496 RepID=UPI0039175901